MPGDHSWKKFDKDMKEIQTALGIAGVGVKEEVPIDIAKKLPDPDKMSSHVGDATTSHGTQEEVPIDVAKALPDPDKMRSHPEDATDSHTQESHNPLDIPFGREVNEINMNPKDPEGTEEGGMGSGRNPEGGNGMGGGQPGPLISFGETIMKQYVDSKINCPCNKN